MIKFGPKAQLTAIVNNWGPYYVERVQAVLDDKWTSGDVWGGLKSKMLVMAPYTNMPDDVKKIAMDTEAAIAAASCIRSSARWSIRRARRRMQGRHASRRRPDPRHELLRQGHRRQVPGQVNGIIHDLLPFRSVTPKRDRLIVWPLGPGSRSVRGQVALTALGRDTRCFVSRTSDPGLELRERRSGTQGHTTEQRTCRHGIQLCALTPIGRISGA